MKKKYESATFATRLRVLRAEKKLTQADLSRVSGVSYAAISLYEAEKAVPTLGNAVALADALGVTLDDLYPMG